MAKTKRSAQTTEATEPSPLLQEILAREVSPEVLLSVGPHREDGVLAQLSRYELQELVPETEGLGMEKDLLLRLARFKVERARLVKLDATQERLDKFDATAREWTTRIFNNHAASQAVKASAKQAATTAKAEQSAQRRATTMNDAPVEQKSAKKATKKAAKKEAPAVEKKAAAPGRKTDNSVYDTMVVATNKESREGTFFDKVTKLAKNPIKLETLIGKVTKEAGDLRSGKDPEAVVRTRVRDAFSRLGYLKAAK